MKSILTQLFLLLLLTIFRQAGYAQKQMIRKTYVQKEATYKAVVRDLYTVRNPKMADTAKPTTTIKIATLYKENNIYPTRGSVALLYKLNPSLDASKPAPDNTQLRMPHFPPASETLLVRARQEYAILKVPNEVANQRFGSLSDNYERELLSLSKFMPFSPGFRDTTAFLRSTILPRIRSNTNIICQAQMNYFNRELGLINQLMEDIRLRGRKDYEVVYSINQMIGDLMEITNLGQDGIPSTGSKKLPTKEKKPPPKYEGSSGKSDFSFASHLSLSLAVKDEGLFESSYTPWDSPPANADIYVYKKDKEGQPQTEPAMNAYEVYLGPNGFIYSLTAGCDTLSFFTISSPDHASTLPLVLGKGNYCFVLRDLNTGKLYLEPDINLAAIKNYDDQHRVIIPFYPEED